MPIQQRYDACTALYSAGRGLVVTLADPVSLSSRSRQDEIRERTKKNAGVARV